MSNIKNQNDWAEFREHLNREMDRQSTSNKALLWVGMALLLALNIVTLCIAIDAEFKIHTLRKDVTDVITDQIKLSTKQVIMQDEFLRVLKR